MKKIFTLAVVALLGIAGAQAQSVKINKTDGTTVTIKATEIKNIEFSPAETSETIVGDYKGDNSLLVGGMIGPYVAKNVVYTVTKNADGSINLKSNEEKYNGTVMGDLTLGTYTISNIPFDATTKSYVRDYSADGLTVHFVCVSEGKTTMDSDYAFKKGNVTVTQGENSKLTIVNTYTIGNMPFPITATFNGVKSE